MLLETIALHVEFPEGATNLTHGGFKVRKVKGALLEVGNLGRR